MMNAGGKKFHRLPVFLSGANSINSSSFLHSEKRPAAYIDGNHFKKSKTDSIRNRSVLMERAVHNIDDLKKLEFEGQSLYTVFTKRGWTGGILEAKGKVYEDIVQDFYEQVRKCNRHYSKLSVYVRQEEVVISPKEIASFLHLPPKQCPNPIPSLEHDEHAIYRALTGTDHVQRDMNGVVNVKNMLPFFQMLHLIVAANIEPTNQTTDTISIRRGKFLLDIGRGVEFDLSNHIFKTIIKAADVGSNCLPFGQLITGLSLEAGVKPRSNEKEVKPADPIHIHLIKPINEIGPLVCPSTQEASSGQSTVLPATPGHDVMLLEIKMKSGVIAELVAPIQRELKGMDSRLKALEDRVRSKL